VSDALRYFVDRQFKQVAACGLSSYGILVDGLIRNGRQKVLHYCVLSYYSHYTTMYYMDYTTTCRQKVLHGDSLRNEHNRTESRERGACNVQQRSCITATCNATIQLIPRHSCDVSSVNRSAPLRLGILYGRLRCAHSLRACAHCAAPPTLLIVAAARTALGAVCRLWVETHLRWLRRRLLSSSNRWRARPRSSLTMRCACKSVRSLGASTAAPSSRR
jgi:hypothetical protein